MSAVAAKVAHPATEIGPIETPGIAMLQTHLSAALRSRIQYNPMSTAATRAVAARTREDLKANRTSQVRPTKADCATAESKTTARKGFAVPVVFAYDEESSAEAPSS